MEFINRDAHTCLVYKMKYNRQFKVTILDLMHEKTLKQMLFYSHNTVQFT